MLSEVSGPSLATAFRVLGFSFATTFSANVMNPGLFGHKILQLVPAGFHNTFLGYLTFLWSVITIFNLPVVGAFSDRTRSRLGKRLPFLILGTLGMSMAAIGVSLSNTLTLLLICVIFLSLFDDTIIAPWLALFQETTPETARGKMAGYKAFLDILAVIGGRQAASLILASNRLSGHQQELILSGTIAVLLLTSLIAVPKSSSGDNTPLRQSKSTLRSIYKIDFGRDRVFLLWAINRLFFWMGFVTLGTFSLFFALDVLQLQEADAHRYVGNLTMVVGIVILIIAIPAGKLADRFDRRAIVFWACLMAGLGTGILVVFEASSILWLAGLLVGTGSGIYMSANLALLTDIVPSSEAGRYMGMAGVASAIGGAAARLLGGLVVDPLNKLTPTNDLGHLVLFAGAALYFVIAGLAILAIPARHRAVPETELPTLAK